jgi:hypothetical protein
MAVVTNPDLVALEALREVIAEMEINWPGGGKGHFDHIDIGYMSKPVAYPYVSLHTTGSRAPVRHLGRGAGKEAREFHISAVIAIEYEDADAKRGFERLTQLRWDVMLELVQAGRTAWGQKVEFTELEDAFVQTFNEDSGGSVDWGFYGQILIPLTIVLRGANL